MGKLTLVSEYNKDFSKWFSQVASIAMANQIRHSQALKTRTRIEVERGEPSTLQEEMTSQIDLTVYTQTTNDSSE